MSKTLSDFIKTLSKNDTKSLSAKALKASEEVGELAKVVLPFDQALFHSHKFSSKEDILEEVADVILCAMSIGYHLDFSEEDIERKLWEKSEYWASLQNSSAKDEKYPFEIHVTVATDTHPERFKEVCKTLGVKAIALALIDSKDTSKIIDDETMTSSKFFGTNKEALDEMKRIATGLQTAGIIVTREKIETPPWHPAGMRLKNKNPQSYFESHFDVDIKANDLPKIAKFAEANGFVMSVNKRKIASDGSMTIILTHRAEAGTTSTELYKRIVQDLGNALEILGFKCSRPLIEYAIFDTNQQHDQEWVNQAS